jgi:hypothetical protein
MIAVISPVNDLFCLRMMQSRLENECHSGSARHAADMVMAIVSKDTTAPFPALVLPREAPYLGTFWSFLIPVIRAPSRLEFARTVADFPHSRCRVIRKWSVLVCHRVNASSNQDVAVPDTTHQMSVNLVRNGM